MREKEIPIIKISHELEDVAEIFCSVKPGRDTSQGGRCYFGLAAVLNPGGVRNENLPFRNDLEERGWDLDAGIIIRQYVSSLRLIPGIKSRRSP